MTARDLRIQVDTIRSSNAGREPLVVLPVSIAEADVVGRSHPRVARDDQHRMSQRPRLDRRPAGLGGDPGSEPPTRAAASTSGPAKRGHRSTPGRIGSTRWAPTSSGFDVDRVVLSSDRAGEPTPVRPAGAPISDAGARVSIESSTDDAYDLRVRTDGSPFWLVLGQSHNDGWEATVDGQSLGAPTLVNGFANGWTVRPDAAGHDGHRAAVDAATRGLDRHRRLRDRGAGVHRAGRRTATANTGDDRTCAVRPADALVTDDVRCHHARSRGHARGSGDCGRGHGVGDSLVDRADRGDRHGARARGDPGTAVPRRRRRRSRSRSVRCSTFPSSAGWPSAC